MKTKSIYLIATYAAKPKHKGLGNTAGWMKDANNIAYDEQVTFSRGLKARDLQTAKIILNLSKASIERNTWQAEKTFPELFSYFYQAYPKYLEPIMQELGYQIQSSDAPVAVENAEMSNDVQMAEVKEITPNSGAQDEPAVQ
jgi:hypothetical protein